MIDPCSRRLSRRTALKAGVAAGFASVLLPALGACTAEDRTEFVTVAGGEPGGFYLEFATLLAASLERNGVARQAAALTTGGSLDNLEQLLAGKATFAVALADAAAQAEGRRTVPGPGITALGRVYENYVHCAVRKASGIRTIFELAGRTVAVGEPGSGTSLTTPRLIDAAGLSSAYSGAGPASTAGQAVTVLNLGLNDGLTSLREGRVDALFWSGGVPTAAIAAAHHDVGFNFLDLSALLPALRATHGAFYDRVLIPDGAYEGLPAVWTVGVTNLLLCRSDLGEEPVKRTVKLLVNQAAELIPRSSLGIQFLSPETLINTAGIPLHPAAAEAYRVLHG